MIEHVAAPAEERPIRIPAGDALLDGDLRVPAGATATVVFAHGSGSSRHSPRNRFVADVLVKAGLATLLIDLLTPDEEKIDLQTAELRFDIGLLAGRLGSVTDWLATQSTTTSAHAIGYFGASTGAAAALIAAVDQQERVRAIVSRGGRPDLAMDALPRITRPTLLIVGGADEVVLDLNRRALAALNGPKELAIVPRATHLFEEPGALDQVAGLARDWFRRYLTGD
ncbi:MAG TPA: dienelactone hydrolase family protein [Candidatus Angelobacter sp.]|nr:dienelactone hydrolase family protein [Candidatus Angelobacter sp.]